MSQANRKPPQRKWLVQWQRHSVVVHAVSKFAAKKLARNKYNIMPNEHLEIEEVKAEST